MTIILQDGEQMEEQHKIACRYGRGTLHVTNHRLIVEINRRGIVFHRHHWQMSNIESRGRNKIRLEWPEDRQMYDFEFDAGRKHKEIVQRIRRRHPYLANFSRGGVTRVIYTERQRQDIRRQRARWVSKKLGRAEKRRGVTDAFGWCGTDGLPEPLRDRVWTDDVEMWRRTMLDVQDDARVMRSTYVPKEIEDHMCWNDCWLVEQSWPDKSYYYTLNYYWMSRRYPASPIKGGMFGEEIGAYRIPAEHVRFYHGCPYVRSDAFVKPYYRVGFFLPTMPDVMLDEDIMTLQYRPYDRCRLWDDEILSKEPIPDLGFFIGSSEFTVRVGGRVEAVSPRISDFFYATGMFVPPALGEKDPERYGPRPTLQQIAERRGVSVDSLIPYEGAVPSSQ